MLFPSIRQFLASARSQLRLRCDGEIVQELQRRLDELRPAVQFLEDHVQPAAQSWAAEIDLLGSQEPEKLSPVNQPCSPIPEVKFSL